VCVCVHSRQDEVEQAGWLVSILCFFPFLLGLLAVRLVRNVWIILACRIRFLFHFFSLANGLACQLQLRLQIGNFGPCSMVM
jgi:hypothetical protein